MPKKFDIAVIGSGFAGSLMALVAKRLGATVVLIEKGKHPRFAIGESSTPLANLLWDEITSEFDLPDLTPFSKWGTWRKDRPSIGCGLKRGFSFYHHEANERFKTTEDRQNELLVAASPHEGIADTHWYREDLDAYLVEVAINSGVEYLEQTEILRINEQPDGIEFQCQRSDTIERINAGFGIDASGPRGCFSRLLEIPELSLPNLPKIESLFAHFRHVDHWANQLPTTPPPPFPVDDAALHHVFPGGWIWALRFNNGIVSAGTSRIYNPQRENRLRANEACWKEFLREFPSIATQFENAKLATNFRYVPNLPYRAKQIVGQHWLMLPSAAGFVDPLLSSGFSLNLLGIQRIGKILRESLSPSSCLNIYRDITEREFLRTEKLVSALYRFMPRPESFNEITKLYFASMIYLETVKRLGKIESSSGFLLVDHQKWGPKLDKTLQELLTLPVSTNPNFISTIVSDYVEPIDLAGLSDRRRNNWHPVKDTDILESAGRLGESRESIQRMLNSSGFYNRL
jgi:FADH2 O2-dependent halogenase